MGPCHSHNGTAYISNNPWRARPKLQLIFPGFGWAGCLVGVSGDFFILLVSLAKTRHRPSLLWPSGRPCLGLGFLGFGQAPDVREQGRCLSFFNAVDCVPTHACCQHNKALKTNFRDSSVSNLESQRFWRKWLFLEDNNSNNQSFLYFQKMQIGNYSSRTLCNLNCFFAITANTF